MLSPTPSGTRVSSFLPLPSLQPFAQKQSRVASWPGQRDEFFGPPLPMPPPVQVGKLSQDDRDRLRQHHFMAKGRKGDEVRELQGLLKVEATGVFDDATELAVKEFQTKSGLRPDGTVGQETWGALLGIPNVDPGTWLLQPDIRAKVESYRNKGDLNQMTLGTITVNGNTYRFRCGGFGRGSIPLGDYRVTPHLWSRSEPPYTVDGVGFTFAVSDKWDDRVGDTRSLLRIHPDGGTEGTHGCIGIVGNGEVQKKFREDVRAMFEQYGEQLMLRMGTT
jgi:hypothetical protein